MKKIRYLFLSMIIATLCVLTVNAEDNINTYSDIVAYRYDEVKGYIKFNALSELSTHDGSYGKDADYDVAFWKVTKNDGTSILQDNEGNQIINIGTNKFEIIDAKRGIFAVGSSLSGWEDIDEEEDNANFEGNFNIYSKDGSLVVSNVAKYNRFDFSNIALIQTNAAAYFLFDTDTLSVTRNLNYDKVEILNYNYVKVTNYGRYSWEDKVGLFNSKGEFIVPAKYQDIFVGSYGITATDKNWNDILFDFNGNALNSSKENAQILKNGYYMVTDKDSGTKSLYDENEQLVCQLPNDVSYISSVYEDGFIIAQDDNNLYGILNSTGGWTTSPQYDSISRAVYQSISYTSINEETEYISRTYKHYVASKNSSYGIIDENNRIIKAFEAGQIREDNGAYKQNDKYFCLNNNGSIVNLKSIASSGIFVLSDSEKYVICKDGYLCSKGYDKLENLGKHVVATTGNQMGVIDINDNIVVPFDEWKIDCWDLNGEAFNRDHTSRYITTKYDDGYYDCQGAYSLDGQLLLPCEYEEVGGSLYLINPETGKYQDFTAEDFDKAGYNRYVIQHKNEKYGYIDDKFNIVVEPKYDYIEFFCDNTAVVGIENSFLNDEGKTTYYTTYGMIDVNGNEILPCQYYKIVNGLSRVIVYEYDFEKCEECWDKKPTKPTRWNVADKDGKFVGVWRDIIVPEKYLVNHLHSYSAGGTAFNKNGYAVVSWGRSHIYGEYVYDHYSFKVIIDKNGNYVSQPFWAGYVGTYVSTKYDEGTFSELDSDSTYIRMGDLEFNHIGDRNRWDGSWKEWNYGDSIILEDGYYGLVDPLSQTILLPAYDYVAQDGSGYWDIRAISLNGQSYFYVTEAQYGGFVKVLDNKGNIVVDGNPTDIRRKYVKINGVYMDNPLLTGGTILDIDEILTTNYYNKSKSHSFKIRDFAKTKYDDDHIFDVQLGNVSGTTDKTGRVKISPDENGFSEVKITADGYLPLTVPSKFIQSYYNNFYMYKDGYSTKPVVHGVFYNASNIYKPDRSSDLTFYSADPIEECIITPIISTNGNNIASVKIVQGDKEIEVKNTGITNVEVKNNKTYGLWLGESEKFKPGMQFSSIGTPIYLVVTTKTGEETKVQLQLKAIEKINEEIDIDMGDEITFNADDGPNSLLGGMQLKYKLFDKLPVSFKFTPVGDGNFTFKATVGVESKEKDKMFETMDDYYKTQVAEAYNKQYDADTKMKKFDNFFKKLADENIASSDMLPSAEIGITCALKMFGYFEGTYNLQEDNTMKLDVTSGGMSAKLSAAEEITRQTVITTPAGPVPTYWKAGLEVGDVIDVKFLTEDGWLVPDSAENELYLSILGGGGVGVVDVASVGASGEGKVTVTCTIPFSKDTLEAVISGKINLFDYELGILSGTLWTIDTPSLELYPDFLEVHPASAYSMQLSRAYTDEELVLNSQGVSLMSLDDGDLNTEHTIVADNTYTFTKPQIAEIDENKLLAVWIEDERSRESDADRTAVYYSVYENEAWSDAQIVSDDTTADFYPTLKKINGEIYLVWSNASDNFAADETDAAKIAKSLTTSVAKWTDGGFELMGNVNNKGVILSDMAIINDVPVVIWTEAADGDLSQSAGVTMLKSAEYIDGAWVENTLLENQKAIDGISVATTNEKFVIYYSQDVDGNVTTSDDKEIFVYSDNEATQITNNDVADTKPFVSQKNVYWYSDSKIAYKEKNGSEINYINANCMSDKFIVSDNDEIITYIRESDEKKQTVYAVCNNDGLWGEPIELITSDKFMASHDMLMNANGDAIVISNEVELRDTNFGTATLDLYKVSQFGDLKVENLTYNEYSMNGEQLHVLCDLSNIGVKSVTGVKVQVSDENGDVVYEVVEPIQVLPGQTVPYTVYVPTTEKSEIVVGIIPMNFEDADLSNNTGKLIVKLKDISLENVELVEIDNKYMITAMAFNRGIEDLENVVVSLRKDSENGEVINSITINTISACDFENVEFIVSGDYSNQVLYVVCEEIENENLYGNNTELVKIPDISKMIVMGDVYGDGVVNSKDAVKLSQYLAKWDVSLTDSEKKAADIVSDGYLNSKDSIKLTQYLAKWNVTLD